MFEEFIQSKSSIMKKDGVVSKTKKVRFDTMKAALSQTMRPCDILDADKTWSKRKKQVLSREVPQEVAEVGSSQASPAGEDQYEVEAIVDHKKVRVQNMSGWLSYCMSSPCQAGDSHIPCMA